MNKLLSSQLGQLCVISEAEYDEMAKNKIYGIPTYVTLKNGYAYVYPLPANVMDLERENEKLRKAMEMYGEKLIFIGQTLQADFNKMRVLLQTNKDSDNA